MHVPDFEWSSSDPLQLLQTDVEESGSVRLLALIPASAINSLIGERLSRRMGKTDQLATARLLGALVAERLAQLNPTAGKEAPASTPETPTQLQIRWWLADQTSPQTRDQIAAAVGCSYGAVALCVGVLERLGFLEKIPHTKGSGRIVWAYSLSLSGLAQSAKDHPDHATRSLILDRIEGHA